MTIDSFANKLIEHVTVKLPSSYHGAKLTVRHETKPGDGVMTGIALKLPGSNVTPCVYIDSFYEELLKGTGLSILADVVAEQMIERSFYSESLTRLLNNFEKTKEHIVSRFIDIRKGRNDAYLKGRVVRRLGSTDIGIIYYVDVSDFFSGDNASVPVMKKHLRKWKVSEDEIDAYAVRNNPRLHPTSVRSFASILNETPQDESPDTVEDDSSDIPMYIVTNREKCNGANVILYPETQNMLQDIFPEGYYVLPSSIHETIVVPSSGSDPLLLLSMVMEINSTEMEAGEVLADDVFVIQNGTLVSCTTDDIPME